MSIETLESITDNPGLISDGDWIESKDQDPIGNIRLIQLADIGDGLFLDKSKRFVNDATLKRLRCTLLHDGDVLIARMPDPLGRACVLPELGQRAIAAVDICIVRPNPRKVDSEWLSFRLNADDLRNKIQSHAQGATRVRVPTGKLKSISFNIPSLEEQRRIANRLKAQLAEVETARQAVQVQLSDTRLLRSRIIAETFDDIDAHPTVLGSVIRDIQAGKSFQTSEILAQPNELGVLKVSAVSWSSFRSDQAKALNGSYEPEKHHRVSEGDFIISRANTKELVGAVVLVDRDYPTRLLSDKTLRLVIDEEQASKEFLLYALRAPIARKHIEHFATGTSDSMRNISQSVITSIPIVLPDLQAQIHIATKLKAQLNEINSLETANKTALADLSQLPQHLLTQAFQR